MYLLLVPLADGWLGLARNTRGVIARRLLDFAVGDPPARLAQVMLAPFSAQIAAAERLSLLLPSELWSIDFAGLPWRAGTLGEHLPLTHRLDVCGDDSACAGPSPDGPPAVGLVVSDPRLDLQGARQEAKRVAQRLQQEQGGDGVEHGAAMLVHAGRAEHHQLRRRTPDQMQDNAAAP